ncbi:MAG: aldehyde ferredoxin oxidoreductase family protein [Candidatus Bathyarchaeota archaeon]|nr:aldehyde ferredoxin oxidoreductase family protein [Candidatus Bathyarchaeota archaeon]MDH5689469.1 aldehyde ferredoxin oxidoreductase family protein [Candidatus Bathyarchaeota archaeon]
MSEKWFGFVGRILRVDLTRGAISKEPMKKEFAKKFLGGVGYPAKILWDELKPRIDPLSQENKLILATGPLTGTLCPGSGSFSACFKSPLTNVWGESRCGGDWGPELKFAGFDLLVLEGKSEKPAYVWICDGDAEIRSAEHLIGKSVPDTESILRREVGDYESKVVSIGPAGEKLVRFACIISCYNRAAGRCGAGAVMGSKNVKAVVVRGHGDIPVAKPDAFREDAEDAEKAAMEHPDRPSFMEGTMAFMELIDELGDLPTKYGASNHWGKGMDMFDLLQERYLIKFSACFSCPLGCGRYSEVKTGKWTTPPYGGPEYETVASFTAFPLSDDIEAAIRASYLCNAYGMDTISCGHAIAFAIECYERGWIGDELLDGVKLTWGNSEAIVTMVEKIARREGFGNTLAEGVRRAAEVIGNGAEELALHVKGLEMPYHDPRPAKTLALQYGTASRGMCHVHPHETHDVVHTPSFAETLVPYGLAKPPIDGYSEEGTGPITMVVQDAGMTIEILGLCKFHAWTGLSLKRRAAILSDAVGWDISDVDLLKIGERVFNLQRCFNVREGLRRRDDRIPKRLREVPAFGPFSRKEAAIVNYEGMLDEYYEVRGWDKKTGIPTRKKLEELELKEVADQLNL